MSESHAARRGNRRKNAKRLSRNMEVQVSQETRNVSIGEAPERTPLTCCDLKDTPIHRVCIPLKDTLIHTICISAKGTPYTVHAAESPKAIPLYIQLIFPK